MNSVSQTITFFSCTKYHIGQHSPWYRLHKIISEEWHDRKMASLNSWYQYLMNLVRQTITIFGCTKCHVNQLCQWYQQPMNSIRQTITLFGCTKYHGSPYCPRYCNNIINYLFAAPANRVPTRMVPEDPAYVHYALKGENTVLKCFFDGL